MFGSKILEVAIGLIFVFMLYSLFASAIQELIASVFIMKARMLRKTIGKMLTDSSSFNQRTRKRNIVYRLYIRGRDFIFFFSYPFLNGIRSFIGLKKLPYKEEHSLLAMFYEQPGIKYLASSRPSDIKSSTFAKTIIDILLENGKGENDAQIISNALETNIIIYNKKELCIDKETLKYLRSLWHDAKQVPDDFKTLMISWYDETMERLKIKYKRYVRFYLFVIGYFIAVTFNVDIISISNRLSVDDNARSEMVQLATAYIESHPDKEVLNQNVKIDSLKNSDSLTKEIKDLIKSMKRDYNAPNNLIAVGWSLPSSFEKNRIYDSIKKLNAGIANPKYRKRNVSVCDECLNKVYERNKPVKPNQKLSIWNKLYYIWCMATNPRSLLGFLITAIGISLGAPFWYELMQKMIKLKNAVKVKNEEVKE